ncbi:MULTISPECIES: phospholipid carrier-dependent glycosyltransferase [unclassified Pseudomonas]|uniref:ArnT family glycosyltransferase n=1 Tax=unclassified Pseudomonas TaxID=196821 RepID=UPI002AC906BD|nr:MULTISPECIES: phospholipid carrier-dependent glycosyltransferase [unclassified Pseudomonas]MEB0039605.1 phospholipid carrier-dependent glycosyltransferase [Pseudomonas sp. MH10]MEB0077068.1 phospholipid carrier-dependent glycosyltransferase [Pseudomonas sp. MH10out]MEB0089870.1 phospholipid carrier-dependent glycosyltransferase [Pseudomonas sp. CCI4.2]MEB0102710.1 phospholipid carrier-dependent glycosyltransferase [Pseudomonas sp. CCI3.2]MEB0120175.1 phospholipid carrier-dependent glycosylt
MPFLPLPQPSAASSATLRRQSIALGVLAFLLFVVGNYQQAAIGFDSRFVIFAQEMLRHGPSFFPTTYGEPYPDYSATSTFFIYLLSLPFGQVISLTAWLPTAIASTVLVTLIYRLVAAHSRTWALVSVALLLLSNTFITETRAISLDQMLATVSFAVFYLGYAADHFGARRRMGLILALLVLGFAIRGPIGLVVPTGMLCSYYVLGGQWRRMFIFGVQAAVLLAVCIGALLLLARLSGGQEFLNEVVRMQFTSRMDGTEGTSSIFYYFSSSLGNYALAYPVAILVLAAIILRGRQPLTPALRLVMFCAAAGLIVMVGLSIPQAKKARYMLPMIPMAAIIAAYPFQMAEGRLFTCLRGLLQGIWLLMPSALIAGLLVAQHRFAEHLTSIGAIISVLAVLQVIALAVLFKARWRAASLAACAVLAVWTSFIWVYEPVERAAYDTHSFSVAVHDLIQRDPAPLALYGMPKDGKAIKFVVNIPEDLKPIFIASPDELAAVKGPVYVVIAKTVYQALPDNRLTALQPLLSSQFDKDDYLLFRLP